MNKFNFYNSSLLGWVILIMAACSTAPRESSERLFPDGIYTQNIQLQIKTKTENKNLPFRSISKLKQRKFEIVALTPFGSTAFTGSGDLTDPESVKLKFYIEVPEFMGQDFIKQTLFKIQGLQNLKRQDLRRQGDRDVYLKEGLRIEIFSYLDRGIPKQFRVVSETWTAFMTTEAYKTGPL